ncbi:MAG: TIGR02217 family protein [Burkholderiaceae bacterium]|nr:TIGR02217 family protein [Burkholderiaceae bacterium]
MSAYLGAALKRRVYPTVLCLHGCVSRRADALVFREAVADIKAHVQTMLDAGYRFVKPSEYAAWRAGALSFDEPVTCLHFDDGLDTVRLVVPWLIERGVPCGLALITRRLGVRDPDDGFLTWAQIYEYAASGLVELMCHTHNIHHLTLLPDGSGGVDVGPVLERPCWIDDGDVVYRPTGDTRWYWDYSFVDQTTLGVPLFGTDPYDGATPITTTLRITPRISGTITTLRLFMALSKPSGAGYDAQVRVTVGSTVVFDDVIAPKQYETRAQWVEREFFTLALSTPFAVTANVPFEMTWQTLNAGDGVALLFAVPTANDTAFRATTTCGGLYPQGSQGAPDRYWQYIDYPANSRWPVVPAIILATGTGRQATTAEYLDYIGADIDAFLAAVGELPRVQWGEVVAWERAGYSRWKPIGWANPGRYTAVVPLDGAIGRTMRYVRIAVGPPEMIKGGDADPYRQPRGAPLPQEPLDRSYPATFRLLVGQMQNVVRSPQVVPAEGIVSVDMQPGEAYVDVVSVTDAQGEYARHYDAEMDPGTGEYLPLSPRTYYVLPGTYGTTPDGILMSPDAVGASVTVTVAVMQSATASPVGLAPIWRITKGQALDVQPYTVQAGDVLVIETVNGGPTVGTEQRTRWGVRRVVVGYVSSMLPALPAPTQVIYPFGSYYAAGTGVVEDRPAWLDIDAQLAALFASRGLTDGYTIAAYRNVRDGELREPALRRTRWALGRWLVYGTQPPADSRNNLLAYSGLLFADVRHRGVRWQGSIEADPAGNASVRARPQTLDYVAFDAYGFDGAGGIVPFPINDGGTYSGTTYADDKSWLQARGVRCLLIINNNLGTGEPDATIGAHVVNNPAVYVPQIVALAVSGGWDGITCNLEGLPASSRAAATAFYAQLAAAMHAAGKLLHATAPAITGTAYDDPAWTGWCDLGALCKVCDAVKIMSYTESGPWGDPAPAAPQWFWDAVYEYVRAVVPEPFWPRVLCGARAFGHLWDAQEPGDAQYIDYHRGIAEALAYGRRIDVDDTEAHWTDGRRSAWFGTPLTFDRAQRTAELWFGGVGVWKLDDGDIEEFLPATRQIGRDEDMDFMDERFPVDVSRGSTGGPQFSTSIVETQSGDSMRNARWTMPLHRYDASLAVRTQQQFDAVRALFMAARGRWRSFRYKDWSDYRASDQQLGIGNGTTTTFQLVKRYVYGAHEFVRKITKPVPGTVSVSLNGVPQASGWTLNSSTGLVSFVTPPGAGVVVRASFEFDVQVRFDVDYLPAEVVTRTTRDQLLFDAGTIALVEVRA